VLSLFDQSPRLSEITINSQIRRLISALLICPYLRFRSLRSPCEAFFRQIQIRSESARHGKACCCHPARFLARAGRNRNPSSIAVAARKHLMACWNASRLHCGIHQSCLNTASDRPIGYLRGTKGQGRSNALICRAAAFSNFRLANICRIPFPEVPASKERAFK